MTIPADMAQLRADDRGLEVTALLGEGIPKPSGGVGGWEVVTIPGRSPIVVWRGPGDALRLALPLVFDRFDQGAYGHSVEPELRRLMEMGGYAKGDPEPPVITLEALLPGFHQLPWVIESIEWGDGLRRPTDGHRVRQELTVMLLRKTEDERMERIRRPSGRPKYRYADVQQGDTFGTIAKRKLGSARLGSRLARLNGARSPDVKLKRDRVRLPTADALKDWKRDLKRGK